MVSPLAVSGADASVKSTMQEVTANEILTKIHNGEPITYNHVIVKGFLDVNKLDLLTKLKIKDSIFDGIVRFNNVVFNNTVDFSGSNFTNDAYFRDSSFNSNADFSAANFNIGTDFGGSKFNEHAAFSTTNFNKYTNFNTSIFEREADFFGASFNYVDFGRSKFNEDAIFLSSTFDNYASFSGSQINGTAYFRNTRFNGEADFRGSEFNGVAYFGNSKFNGPTNIKNEAIFNQGVDLRGAQFNWKKPLVAIDYLSIALILVGLLAILGLVIRITRSSSSKRVFGTEKTNEKKFFKSPELNEVEVVKALTRLETDLDWVKKLVWFTIITILGILIKIVYESVLLPKGK